MIDSEQPQTDVDPANPLRTWGALIAAFVVGAILGAWLLDRLPGSDPEASGTQDWANTGNQQVGDSPQSEQKPTEQREDSDIARVERDLRQLREELARLTIPSKRTAPPPEQDDAPVSRTAAAGKQKGGTSGERTLTYWNELNAILSREVTMRNTPAKLTVGKALSFISGRQNAYKYAAGAIRALNAQGVDRDVVSIGGEIADWYEQGQAIGGQAESLIRAGNPASRRGPQGQQWRTAEERHREKCIEINRRGASLRKKMAAKYGRPFPELQ